MMFVLVSCVEKSEQKIWEKNNREKSEIKIEEKFWDITKYLKDGITDTESKELLKILEDRKVRQAEIKKIIESATKENKDEIYNSIIEKRKICINRILPYIWEVNINSFKKYCENINFQIKNKLDEL